MKDSGFYFKWGPFFLGLFFALLGVLFTMFSREERRDKIYSALAGFAINLVISLLLMKYGGLPDELLYPPSPDK